MKENEQVVDDFNLDQILLIKDIMKIDCDDLEKAGDVFMYEVCYDYNLTLWEEQNPDKIGSSQHSKLVCSGRVFKIICVCVLAV